MRTNTGEDGVFRMLTLLAALVFGFAFLYAPIALLVIYSFNASRLVTVWGGFSTRWMSPTPSELSAIDTMR